MNSKNYRKAVIVDYGLGNLFSVEKAIKYMGVDAETTDNAEEIVRADYLILPGVGAFKDGMDGLRSKKLIEPICKFLDTEKPFLGICLGMQLLMTESEEFGLHKGLDFVKGKVVKFSNDSGVKIPHMGWNSVILPLGVKDKAKDNFWKNTIFENIKIGDTAYFVHSYIAIPDDQSYVLSETKYGSVVFCSAFRKDNIFACQFHPEKSGETGLKILKQFLKLR